MLISIVPTPAWGKAKYWPTGIQLSIDAFRPFHCKYYGRKGTPYEYNAAIDFSSWILEGDYGYGNVKWEGPNPIPGEPPTYTSEGKYFRLGLNYNLLQDTPDKNMAFLGFRYARSFFSDHLVSKVCYNETVLIDSEHLPINSKQDNVKARWFEAVAGVKVKVWKFLYVGGTVRYRFGLHLEGANSHVPYDVLGWGLNDNKRPFTLNLYLSLRIPLARTNTKEERCSSPITRQPS